MERLFPQLVMAGINQVTLERAFSPKTWLCTALGHVTWTEGHDKPPCIHIHHPARWHGPSSEFWAQGDNNGEKRSSSINTGQFQSEEDAEMGFGCCSSSGQEDGGGCETLSPSTTDDQKPGKRRRDLPFSPSVSPHLFFPW